MHFNNNYSDFLTQRLAFWEGENLSNEAIKEEFTDEITFTNIHGETEKASTFIECFKQTVVKLYQAQLTLIKSKEKTIEEIKKFDCNGIDFQTAQKNIEAHVTVVNKVTKVVKVALIIISCVTLAAIVLNLPFLAPLIPVIFQSIVPLFVIGTVVLGASSFPILHKTITNCKNSLKAEIEKWSNNKSIESFLKILKKLEEIETFTYPEFSFNEFSFERHFFDNINKLIDKCNNLSLNLKKQLGRGFKAGDNSQVLYEETRKLTESYVNNAKKLWGIRREVYLLEKTSLYFNFKKSLENQTSFWEKLPDRNRFFDDFQYTDYKVEAAKVERAQFCSDLIEQTQAYVKQLDTYFQTEESLLINFKNFTTSALSLKLNLINEIETITKNYKQQQTLLKITLIAISAAIIGFAVVTLLPFLTLPSFLSFIFLAVISVLTITSFAIFSKLKILSKTNSQAQTDYLDKIEKFNGIKEKLLLQKVDSNAIDSEKIVEDSGRLIGIVSVLNAQLNDRKEESKQSSELQKAINKPLEDNLTDLIECVDEMSLNFYKVYLDFFLVNGDTNTRV
ncbi:hypothetical protein BN1013_01282 [Candidatus Rubidus massiliensis]|nr:hypothetical protein BN1013_01282 [Candidatus Rubidus massiliensis]